MVKFGKIICLKGNYFGFKVQGVHLTRETIEAIARSVRPKIAFFSLIGIIAAGCPNNGATTGGGESGATGASGSKSFGGTTSSTSDAQCAVFKNSSRDLSACLGCKQSLCPCTTVDPIRPDICLDTDQKSCTLDMNQLVECVHNNVASGGGPCVGLRCGDGQIADFTSCLCRDATPPSSIGPAPGYEDTTIPRMQPGFFVTDRFCPLPDVSTNPTNSNCLLENAGTITTPGSYDAGAVPRYLSQSPANVFVDVGYMRWDLGLDASQFGPGITLQAKKPFLGTWATFPMTLSTFYQLKPNTMLANSAAVAGGPPAIKFNDCAEHFSGYTLSSGATSLSTVMHCDARASSGTNEAKAAISLPIVAMGATAANPGGVSGTASVANVSINGGSANDNVLSLDKPGNPKMRTLVGLAKKTAIGGCVPAAETCDTTAATGTSMLSNIGYYKYTWGPLYVKRLPSPGSSAARPILNPNGTYVSASIAANVNMGFTPASAVESSAMSPLGMMNSVPTRDCSVNSIPYSCVVTAAYRTPGGGVIAQSFSPSFSATHHASTMMALPTGISAVSSPKLIEDTSQLEVSDTFARTPARLRAFVRASDGNIYMSRFEATKWQPWLSLGRPWICKPTEPACTNLATTLPPVYGPAGTFATDPTKLDYANGDINDGLSIASEPTVVSFMRDNKTYANVGGVYAGAPLTVSYTTAATVLGITTLSVYFTTDPRTFLSTGTMVYLNGFQMTAGNVNDTKLKITDVTSDHIEFASSDAQNGVVAGVTLTSGSGITNAARITKYKADTPNDGIIAVFVRVSQLKSSTGLPGTMHNSVWYTFAKMSNEKLVSGQPLFFDKPANWSQWQLVQDANADGVNSFRIQGNPLAILTHDDATDAMRLSVFATSAIDASNTDIMLHPPVAPQADTNRVDTTVGTVNTWDRNSYLDMHANWYNYGTTLVSTSILISTVIHTENWAKAAPLYDTYAAMFGAPAATDLGFRWEAVAPLPLARSNPVGPPGNRTFLTGGIVSDWSYAPVTGSNNIRLFAMSVVANENPCYELARTSGGLYSPALVGAVGTEPLGISPCKYTKEMVWVEYTLTAAAGMPSYQCRGIYSPHPMVAPDPTLYPNGYDLVTPFTMSFVGTPHPINIAATGTNASAINQTSLSHATAVADGSFIPGASYQIATLGDTDWQNVGLPSGATASVGRSFVATNAASGSALQSGTAKQINSMLVFGRAVCPEKGRCDNVNPTAAYLAAKDTTECGGAGPYDDIVAPNRTPESVMYFSGQNYSWYDSGGGTWISEKNNRTPVPALATTADVLPIASKALKYNYNDGGFYLFTRNLSGYVTHGYWEGKTSQSPTDPTKEQYEGSRSLMFYTLGPYIN